MTRVLVLTQYYEPEGPIPTSLAEGLASRGFQVEVLTAFPHHREGRTYGGYRQRPWLRESIHGIPVTRVPLYPSHDKSPLRRILTYATFGLSSVVPGRFLVRRPDVIYAYYPPTTIGLSALVHRVFRRHIPVIGHVQDLWPEAVSSSGMVQSSRALKFLSGLSRWVYKRTDLILTISPGFKAAIEAYGVDPEKIEVIYNWANEAADMGAKPDPDLPTRPGIKDPFTIVYAGNIGMVQALDTVLEAAIRLNGNGSPVQFLLLGSGAEEETLRKKAEKEQIKNVAFLGRKSPSEAAAIVNCAQAALIHLKDHPMFDSWIPGKTQSLLAIGKPILLGVRGDAAHLVLEAGAGLAFKPSDPVSLAEEASKMASMDPGDLAAMGARGKDYYMKHLSFDLAIKKIASMVERLADKGNR